MTHGSNKISRKIKKNILLNEKVKAVYQNLRNTAKEVLEELLWH